MYTVRPLLTHSLAICFHFVFYWQLFLSEVSKYLMQSLAYFIFLRIFFVFVCFICLSKMLILSIDVCKSLEVRIYRLIVYSTFLLSILKAMLSKRAFSTQKPYVCLYAIDYLFINCLDLWMIDLVVCWMVNICMKICYIRLL